MKSQKANTNHGLIHPLDCRQFSGKAGNKARNLCLLMRIGVPVPETYVCDWEVHERCMAGSAELLGNLAEDLARVIEPGISYAVRSSSNLEDEAESSFAGQFISLLNVSGADAVLDAIQKVWSAVESEQVSSYKNMRDLAVGGIQMGVIIQKMVTPRLSGVALSSHPVTGEKDIIIEAVEGLGDLLMQKGTTPLRWVFRNGKTLLEAKAEDPYRGIVEAIAAQTALVSRKLKQEVDLEWVYDGQKTYFVQVREIGGLRALKIYSNRISKDMLPGLIKPLIWSVNIPLINSVWIRLLENFVGSLGIQPEDLARQFYYRSYFNMGIFGRIFNELGMPSDALEMMMGLREKDQPKPNMMPGPRAIRHIPRMTRFMFSNLFFARKMRKELDRLEREIDNFKAMDVTHLSPQELFDALDKLKPLVQQIVFFNITGPLAMSMYNNLLRKKLEKIGVDFLSFDLMKDSLENQRYDPNVDLEKINTLYQALPDKAKKQVEIASFESLSSMEGINEFVNSLNLFIEKFGHFSDSGNDFSFEPWREKKNMILRMVLDFRKNEPTSNKTSFDDLGLKGMARNRLARTYQRARDYRNLRDRVSSDYTFGYGLFRIYYLALGKHLARMGVIQAKDDIFYLTDQQVRQVFNDPDLGKNYKKIVRDHKKKMTQVAHVVVPERIIGDEEPILGFEEKNKLGGIPASAGIFKGKACVISRVEDFPKMKNDQVLVIPYSDVGWTPLFAKAGAVVAESGGMLSHSAIIAREYGLPAVVSVSGAMTIRNGRLVTVDANNGIVYLHD